jgi:hypothetical protein
MRDVESMRELAARIARRNVADKAIAELIGRPAQRGHIVEFIAARMFDIWLHDSATHVGSEGVFTTGPLKSRSVNIKFYGAQEGILDVKESGAPDYYVVPTGPRRTAATSRGLVRPLVVEHIYVFAHAALLEAGVKPGVAASVRKAPWDAAVIYPRRERKLRSRWRLPRSRCCGCSLCTRRRPYGPCGKPGGFSKACGRCGRVSEANVPKGPSTASTCRHGP